MMTKDPLEIQGIRWMIESHFTGVKLTVWNSVNEMTEALQKERANFVILDMDGWGKDFEKLCSVLQQKRIRWLGISSERIFQTAYRALTFRAEDVLFRPFSPDELIKRIQQLRFILRNEQTLAGVSSINSIDTYAIDYPNFFLTDQKPTVPITMVALLTPNEETLQLLYNALQRYPFPNNYKLFALSDFILCVQESDRIETIREVYNSFFVKWKERMDEPLAIVINMMPQGGSIKEAYQQTKQLTKRIFYEGYDIILADYSRAPSREMDPFLTPLEQREWIEMLEKQDMKAIKQWVEHEFLTYERPYPDPEMIRIRITSVLAQIRRHMKSYNLQGSSLEAAYHEVFHFIIHNPVIYHIVQKLLMFTASLLQQVQKQIQEGTQSFVEKVRELVEANYWNASWNLAACADILRMNKSTLSRRFAAESGQSFRVLLHEVRIREAKRLLQETNQSLDEIARLTGYSHQTYFNAKFKQLVGCTPSAFRNGF